MYIKKLERMVRFLSVIFFSALVLAIKLVFYRNVLSSFFFGQAVKYASGVLRATPFTIFFCLVGIV